MRRRSSTGPDARRCYLSLFLECVLLFSLAFSCACRTARAELVPDPANASWNLAKSDPHALVRATIDNELKHSYGHRPPVRYRLRKQTRNTDTTKEIVETKQGGVARLVAIHNLQLNATQTETELRRLGELASDPAAQQHRLHNEERDAARLTALMRLLPDAFINQYEGSTQTPNCAAIRVSFTPNPRFVPPTLESRVLTGIRGEIWIDPADLRVVRIEGHVFREVDYGWGILGTLYPGGAIRIDQSKTQDCGWQLAHLLLNLKGKELMLKSLRIDVDETATGYHPVPAGWKYTDAIAWLLRMTAFSPLKANEH